MDLEIELNIKLDSSLAQNVREMLDERFTLVAFKVPGKYSLRPQGLVKTVPIDEAIRALLESIETIGPLLERADGIVRVGAFFLESEAAAFSVVLSPATVQTLAKFQFAVDVTCYPCS